MGGAEKLFEIYEKRLRGKVARGYLEDSDRSMGLGRFACDPSGKKI